MNSTYSNIERPSGYKHGGKHTVIERSLDFIFATIYR